MLRREHKIKTLDTKKVAWLLNIDGKEVNSLVNMGVLKPYRTNRNGERLFRRSDVAILLEKLGG